MESPQAKFAVDAINIVQERVALDADVWDSFCRSVKTVLDSRFGGEWNVLIGKAVGYAMKTKKKSHIVVVSSSGEIVICWKSPGFEVEDVNVVKLKAEFLVNGTPIESESISKLTVIQSPSPDLPGYTGNTPKAISLLDEMIEQIKPMESQEGARFLRNHLTARFGTIWHVAIGDTRAYHVLPADNATDHIVVATKRGGMKIEIFRHKQTTPAGFSATIKNMAFPRMSTIIDIIPTLCFIVLCICFLLQKSPVCQTLTSFNSKITEATCTVVNSIPLAPLAGIVFVLILLKQVKKSMQKRKLKHQ